MSNIPGDVIGPLTIYGLAIIDGDTALRLGLSNEDHAVFLAVFENGLRITFATIDPEAISMVASGAAPPLERIHRFLNFYGWPEDRIYGWPSDDRPHLGPLGADVPNPWANVRIEDVLTTGQIALVRDLPPREGGLIDPRGN